MISYEQHPLSAIFPAMDDTAFSELRADIAAHGLHSPITMFEGKVLDGWHRYRACTDTGVVARYVQFDGSFEQAMPFVISINMQRRHLSTSQRAMIAGRLATLERGRPNKWTKLSIKSVAEAAAMIKVGPATVKHARIVLTQATPEIIARVERNELSVSRAVKDIREARPKPVKRQPELPAIIARWDVSRCRRNRLAGTITANRGRPKKEAETHAVGRGFPYGTNSAAHLRHGLVRLAAWERGLAHARPA